MSATVAPLAHDDLFWFLDERWDRYHAFELIQGQLESRSLCDGAPIEVCADVPEHDAAARFGLGCVLCLSMVTA